jgi:hypothetical protein
MGKGGKIALGCGCVVLLAAAAVVAMFGAGAFWAKSKLTELKGGLDRATAKSEEIQRWSSKADAVAYSAPADGVIQEARLLKFLEVRKSVFAVYQTYEADLKELQARSKAGDQRPSFSEAIAAGGKFAEVFSELRLAQVKALAEVEMNEVEYRDIQVAVYKTAWAAETQKQTGKLPSEAVGEAGEQVERAMEKASAEASEQGVPGAGQMSEEQRRQVREAMQKAAEAAKSVEVPQANIDLFRKHEAEIRKYAMSGLELLGF